MKSKRINLKRPIQERDMINKDYAFLKIADLRRLGLMYSVCDISYSRVVELINELAYDFYREKRNNDMEACECCGKQSDAGHQVFICEDCGTLPEVKLPLRRDNET